MNVYFVRTRHHYAPYDDFFKLADLSGYTVIYVDEMQDYDKPGDVFIISPVNGEWKDTPKGYYKGRIILYQLEWNWDGEHNTPACVDEVWNCDPAHARLNGFKYVLMGSHEGLNELPPEEQFFPAEKIYDVSFLAYQTGRRQQIAQEMRNLGLRLAPSEQLWGLERNRVLMKSRVMVHVHQREDTKGIAPLRWALAAAHRLPVVSEFIQERGRFGYTHMAMASYSFLPAFVKMALTDRMLDNYGLALHGFLCHEWPFRKTIEANL